MRFIFLIVFVVTVTKAWAQHPSTPPGAFTVDRIKGCATLPVTIDATATCGNCDISYTGQDADKKTFAPSETYLYDEAGLYTIKLFYGVGGLATADIEVFENIAPTVEVARCGNYGVSVFINDNKYNEYIINYGDGSAEQIVPPNSTHQHTYADGSQRSISVRGRNTGAYDNCQATTIQVEPLAVVSTPTLTKVEAIDNSSVRIEFAGEPQIRYRIEIAQNNNTSFQLLKTVINTTVDTIRNLRLDDSYYCFRISGYDPCANTSAPYRSNIVCTANFDLTLENNQNRLNWVTNNSGVTSQLINGQNAGLGNSFIDADVTCGTEYCYQLTMNYAPVGGLPVSSISLPKCGIAISTDKPSAISDISSVVEENQVTLSWQTDAAFTPAQFTILKNSEGTSTTLAQTNQPQFSDNTYSLENPSCYQVSYTDVCGNTSDPSLEACPIVLTGNVNNDNSIQLNWSAYTGWTNGVYHYIIDRYSVEGQLINSIDASSATSYLDATQDLNEQIFVYIIRAIPNDGGVSESVSNRVVITKEPNLFHPTAFTPNGDGLNDVFNVYGQYIENFEMDIFNRWGELMFTTSQIDQGWDGTYKGNPMPEGTYTFVTTITDRAGRTFKRSGTVVLLKKK